MPLPRRAFLRLAAVAAACPMVSSSAGAEAYPTRPVRLLVGFGAGGNFDVVARIVSERLSDRLGQQVVVENRPGASSNLAIEAVVRAPADGYTLVLGGAVNAVNATLFEKLSFNFIGDLVPVASLVRFPNVIVVSPTSPAKTLPEFIAHAKANPGKLNHGSSGIGTTQHLAGELFKTMVGVDFVHIPYQGAAPVIADLLSGNVQVAFEALPPSIGHIRAGTLRALAVTTTDRAPALPDVPSVAEFIPGYEASGWNGVLAPKNTPTDIIERLNHIINDALADFRISTRLANIGAVPFVSSSADFGNVISQETEKWARVIRTANIKAL